MKERRTSLFRHGMAQSQGPGVGEERALDQALEALVEVAQVPFAQVRRVALRLLAKPPISVRVSGSLQRVNGFE